MSTLLLIMGAAGLLGLSLLLAVIFLRLGLRWVKVSNATFARVLGAVLLIEGCRIGMLLASGILTPQTQEGEIAIVLISLLAIVFMSVAIISRLFQTSFWQSTLAWFATLIPAIPLLLLTVFVVKPYCVEGFKIVANSMAPTLIADHLESECPTCGNPNYCSIPSYFDPREEPSEEMICAEFHVTQAKPNLEPIRSNDRILAVKFLKPKRWDLLVFHFPEDPTMTYVKRLVGLPGETITIKEGKIYANDVLQTPPAELTGIEYLSQLPGSEYFPPVWGSTERPATLGEDEYFVLGDFSARSKDSRLWEKGAAGHAPYAVPHSLIIGVATHLYWPLNRMRAFR